jgi:hypothetical protein
MLRAYSALWVGPKLAQVHGFWGVTFEGNLEFGLSWACFQAVQALNKEAVCLPSLASI